MPGKNILDQDIRDNILVIENKKPNCSQIHCFFSFQKDILANCNPQVTGPINYSLLFEKKKKTFPHSPAPDYFGMAIFIYSIILGLYMQ